jgi:peptide/nickel transport system substrate-binding protein
VHETPGLRVVYIGFNAKLPPLDDVRVRQALLQAVDRKAIIENIVEGLGVAPKSVISPGVFGYKDMQFDQLFPFDRAKAKALLAQAGWTPGPDGILQKGGQKLTLNWLAQRGRYPKDGEITEAVQQMWKEVGVDARSSSGSGRPSSTSRASPTGAATTGPSAGPRPTPMPTTRFSLSTTRRRYHRVEPVRLREPEGDQLLEAARRSLNQSEREKMYGEVQDILAKDTLWVPVYNTKEIIITRASVKGFVIHPVEYNLGLWKTWLDK